MRHLKQRRHGSPNKLQNHLWFWLKIYKGPGQSLRKKEPGFVDDMVVVYVLFVLTSFRRMFVQYRASIWKSNPWSGGTLGELLELWPAALLFVPLLANSSSPCFPLFQIREFFFGRSFDILCSPLPHSCLPRELHLSSYEAILSWAGFGGAGFARAWHVFLSESASVGARIG